MFLYLFQTGMIAMRKHNLFIRPLKYHHAEEYRRRSKRDVDNLHIIYRRSIRDQDEENSAVDDRSGEHFCGLDKGKLVK